MVSRIQAPAVSEPLRVPLVSNLEARDGFLNRGTGRVADPQLVNCFAEFNPKDKSFTIEKRPGYSAPFFTPDFLNNPQGVFAFVPNGAGLGLGTVITINSGKAYCVHSIDPVTLTCTVNFLGDVNAFGKYYFEVIPQPPGFAKLIVFGNGAKAYSTTGAAGDLTELLVADDFPATFYQGWAYLNSRLYVAWDRNIQGALNLNDPLIWDPLNLIVAQDEPDDGVALAKHLTLAVYFKQWSTEFFEDQGNPVGSTLGVVPQNALDIGCIDPETVNDIDGSLFWVASSEQRKRRVARLDNLRYTIVSTPAIEKILENYTVLVSAYVLRISGHRFYIINTNGGLGSITLVYDIDQELWYIWERANPVGGPVGVAQRQWKVSNATVTNGSTGSTNKNLQIVQLIDGTLCVCEPGYIYPTDDGAPCTVEIYTPSFDGGVDRRKQVNMMYFNAENVEGSSLQIRMNDFDYREDKWTNFRQVDLDVEKPQLENCGTFYRRAHHIKHELPVHFKISSVGLQVDIGTL